MITPPLQKTALLLATIFSACLVTNTYGVPMEFNVRQGPANGASYSHLHRGTGGHMEFNGNDFWTNGSSNRIGTTRYMNTLWGDYDSSNQSLSYLGGILNIGAGSGPFDGPGRFLVLYNGNFNFSGLSEGDLVGSINYWIRNTRRFGTFYFYHYDFTGTGLGTGPNSLTTNGNLLDIQLWGNDIQQGDFGSAPHRLGGLDLRITGTSPASVPDNGTTFLLLALGLLFLVPLSRKLKSCPGV